MPTQDETSGPINEQELQLLIACHHRKNLRVQDVVSLIGATAEQLPLASLQKRGFLEEHSSELSVTQAGRDFLDQLLCNIERELTPDSPEFERRFRREEPSLPFAANTTWAEAFCINFRVDPEALRPLIPSVFGLDTFEDHAFVSLTISRLKKFGAGSIPDFMRMNFYQSTYRAHVTYTDFRGDVLRGCYFIRSETNSNIMSLTANLLPEFKAHHCSTYPIFMARDEGRMVVSVDSGVDAAGKVVLVVDTAQSLETMPADSIFPSIHEARELIVDFYDAFSYDPATQEVFLLRIERGEWNIQILDPIDSYFGMIEDGPFPKGTASLDSVFYFQDCPYLWLPLIKERIQHGRQ